MISTSVRSGQVAHIPELRYFHVHDWALDLVAKSRRPKQSLVIIYLGTNITQDNII